MDVVGYLTKGSGPKVEEVQNTSGPMTSRAARDYAERLRQLGYTVRVTRHRAHGAEYLQGVEHGRWARTNIPDALARRDGQPSIEDILRYGPKWARGYIDGAKA